MEQQSNSDAQQLNVDQPPAGWLARNGLPLLLVGAALGLLFYYGAMMSAVGLVVLGLGLVIFIHELGHFVAAKLCDVHVEAFSIGFGPSLPGCETKYGETTYKVGMIPLGGYVKMVGEGADSEEGEDDPRSYKNKSVGQRMVIISAGVVMNIILAVVGFVSVYMTCGVERMAGVIGMVESGSPAWQLGLRSGTVITKIGSSEHPFFDDIRPKIVFSAEGQRVPLSFILPGSSTPIDSAIEAKFDDEGTGMPLIGVNPANTTTLRGSERLKLPPYMPGSAASQAKPEMLVTGDRIVAATDPAKPDGPLTNLPLDSRQPEHDQRDYFDFYRRLVDLAGQPIRVRVANAETHRDVETTIPPAFYRDLGLVMRMGQIVAVRDASPAARAGVRPRTSEPGDIIKQVEVAKPDGGVIRYVTTHSAKSLPDVEERTLDPMRLPAELERWAAKAKAPKKVKLTVLRPSGHAERTNDDIVVDWDDGWKYAQEWRISARAPLAISGLGLAYRVETLIEEVEAGSVADKAGLKPGDVIKAIQFYRGTSDKPELVKNWLDIKGDQWVSAFAQLHEIYNSGKFSLKIQRADKAPIEVTLEPPEDQKWPMVNRGFDFVPDTRLQKASSATEALSMGAQRVAVFAGHIYLSLKAMVQGRISFNKQANGPISIAVTSYNVAGDSFPQFVLFLSLLSVNLAVINFLPIPLLDGGHMVFLLYEKFRGRPAPEGVRVAATFAGVALIASLMLYVLVLDVMKYIL